MKNKTKRAKSGLQLGAPQSPIKLAVAYALAGMMSIAIAAPQGGEVVAGAANISSTATRTDVTQRTERAVINWQSFDIAANEHVNFQQPSASSVTLNRISGNHASQILGRLTANGGVYLVNPQGIYFGKNATVNVGSLVAATANIRDDDFMAGKLRFSEPGAPGAQIRNDGQINIADTGIAAFVAPEMRNAGVINARLGKVAMGAGEVFTLDLYGDQLLSLVLDPSAVDQLVDASGRPLRHVLEQGGTISAAGGHVQLAAVTAKGLVDGVINLSGVTQVASVSEHGGTISLLAGPAGEVNVAGVLDASSSTGDGGYIAVSGDAVRVAGNAQVVASGAVGGEILLGGDYQGRGSLPNAQRLNVDAGAVIAADGTNGNGGKVILWSDGRTRFAGDISARGGAAGGDGGFVEVSGKEHLSFAGLVDASAPAGAAGTLLLDPRFLIIRAGDDADDEQDPDAMGTDALDDVVGTNVIRRMLRAGMNVKLDATNDIFVDGAIDGTGGMNGASLSLTAATGLIAVNESITTAGAVNLKAGSDILLNNVVTTNGGALTLDAGNDIALNNNVETAGGAVMLKAGGDIAALDNTKLMSGGGLINLMAGGAVTTPTVIAAGSGNIDITAASNVRVQNVAGGNLIVKSSNGDITLMQSIGGDNAASPEIGVVDLDAKGNIIVNGINARGQVLSTDPGLRVVADGTITSNKKIAVNDGPILFGTEQRPGTGLLLKDSIYSRNGYAIDIWPSLSLGIGPDLSICSADASKTDCFARVPMSAQAPDLKSIPKIIVSNNEGYFAPDMAKGSQAVTLHGGLDLSSEVLLKLVSFYDPNDVTTVGNFALFSEEYLDANPGRSADDLIAGEPDIELGINTDSEGNFTHNNSTPNFSFFRWPVFETMTVTTTLPDPDFLTDPNVPPDPDFVPDRGSGPDTVTQAGSLAIDSRYGKRSYASGGAFVDGQSINQRTQYVVIEGSTDASQSITGAISNQPQLGTQLVGTTVNYEVRNQIVQVYEMDRTLHFTGEIGFPATDVHVAVLLFDGLLATDLSQPTGDNIAYSPGKNPGLTTAGNNGNTTVTFATVGTTLGNLGKPADRRTAGPTGTELRVTPKPDTPPPTVPETGGPMPRGPDVGGPTIDPIPREPKSTNNDSTSQAQNQIEVLGQRDDDEPTGPLLLRGAASQADLGRSGSSGATTDVFNGKFCVLSPGDVPVSELEYFEGCR